MFRLLLLVLLCQIPAYLGLSQARVEVTVMGKYSSLHDSEVEGLFNDYGKGHDISSSDMHVHRTKNCNAPSESPAKFEAYVTSCDDFRTYLLHFGRWLSRKYNLKMIDVECEILHFSLCLAHSCLPEERISMASCAYT